MLLHIAHVMFLHEFMIAFHSSRHLSIPVTLESQNSELFASYIQPPTPKNTLVDSYII
jgi:hypothetical protein